MHEELLHVIRCFVFSPPFTILCSPLLFSLPSLKSALALRVFRPLRSSLMQIAAPCTVQLSPWKKEISTEVPHSPRAENHRYCTSLVSLLKALLEAELTYPRNILKCSVTATHNHSLTTSLCMMHGFLTDKDSSGSSTLY